MGKWISGEDAAQPAKALPVQQWVLTRNVKTISVLSSKIWHVVLMGLGYGVLYSREVESRARLMT